MAPVLLLAKPNKNKAIELRMPKSAKAMLGINVIIKKYSGTSQMKIHESNTLKKSRISHNWKEKTRNLRTVNMKALIRTVQTIFL